MKLGIDFGTTNSAVAVVARDGHPRVLELAPGEPIQRTVIHCDLQGTVRFGNAAFRAYEASDLQGRFLRSLKAFLPQNVPATTLGRKRVLFTELIGFYLRFLVDRAEEIAGEAVSDVVVGRPVRFHADPKRHDRALRQLREAIAFAGIEDYRLVMEPVAAAHRYEHGLTSDRVVLVGDFGGGTADFAILKVGPGRTTGHRRDDDVLGVSGVAKAGDAIDGRFMDAFLLEYFGRGAFYEARYTKEIKPWNHPILLDIQQLHYVHMLRTQDLKTRLERMEFRVTDPTVVRRLLRLIFDDLGFPMAWAIERTKREFSDHERTVFRFGEFYSESLDITHEVDRPTFAQACGEILGAYRGAIDEVLEQAGISAAGVDDVFLTGGTSQLPFVRAVLGERFGADKLRDADAFSSVSAGLALA